MFGWILVIGSKLRAAYSRFLTGDSIGLSRPGYIGRSQSQMAEKQAAISVAATFFGGFTYIGDSPNLLIRAIVEIAARAGTFSLILLGKLCPF